MVCEIEERPSSSALSRGSTVLLTDVQVLIDSFWISFTVGCGRLTGFWVIWIVDTIVSSRCHTFSVFLDHQYNNGYDETDYYETEQ
jgi:hypothetical protein